MSVYRLRSSARERALRYVRRHAMETGPRRYITTSSYLRAYEEILRSVGATRAPLIGEAASVTCTNCGASNNMSGWTTCIGCGASL